MQSSNPTAAPAPAAILPPAIRVSRVGKTYRMWSTPGARLLVPLLFRAAGLLRHAFPPGARRLQAAATRRLHSHEALHDINLELRRGEALGIIGLNGSGKSTLLQIIAGVLQPTTGVVETHGRVAALLELGSGFNPELTGRENIRINAAILGLDQATVDARMGDIIEFADIGNYIDEPIKTYSSGMVVRLAFAVQVHADPDILIVDEALAVGDAAFQAKAMARIDRILSSGTTLLFVGHDLNVVKAFCHRAMLLERGRVALDGLPDEVIAEYLLRTHRKALQERRGEQAAMSLQPLDDGYGMEDARVVAATLNRATHATIRYGDRVEIDLKVRLRPDLRHPGLILDVMDGKGLQITGRRIALQPVESVTEVPLWVAFDASFQQGIYRVRLRVVDSPHPGDTVILARHEGGLSFEIVDDSRAMFTGLFPIPMEIRGGA
ncbi:polysaccharide ABC transporter ATP-binding protein [Luteimonas sp. 8-5]|uniref:ABC transporter ATP-binding protein n=1 Tax=Luteimonas sp. 8-5 TaxID=3039387 RepID=UPI00243741F2|nr:polysaccharide ABC transporter ATP-binding protein [Luteimonas sp. 8-5]MDG6348868.1 polysaccharide ABC transporter ATP-binding protein [Luteimonas sp. 8-5]